MCTSKQVINHSTLLKGTDRDQAVCEGAGNQAYLTHFFQGQNTGEDLWWWFYKVVMAPALYAVYFQDISPTNFRHQMQNLTILNCSLQGWEFAHQFSSELLVFCQKISEWAIRSKKRPIPSFAHFWWATWAICSWLLFAHQKWIAHFLNKKPI